MDNGLKKSLSILKHEFGLQLYTFSFVLFCFLLSICLLKFAKPAQPVEVQPLIVLYAMFIGFTLPWQLNTKGHISPGYCRYHLSMPVRSCQLYIIPLIFRLLLIFLFFAVAYGVYMLFYYSNGGAYYFSFDNLLYYVRISVLIYIVLQAYGWSKDSIKNLYLYWGIAFIICVLKKTAIIAGAFDVPWFFVVSAAFAALSIIGLRNLRVGKVFELPGLQSLLWLINRKSFNERVFKNRLSAQFHQEWRRTWYIMPALTVLMMLILMILDYKTSRASTYSLERDIGIVTLLFFFTSLVTPLVGVLGAGNFKTGSSYFNHLPISSKSLADIKLKCFFLSYAVSFALFLAFVIYKLFETDTTWVAVKYSRSCIFFNALNARSMEFFQYPSVVIWSLIAAFIWAFVLASLMVVICINKNNRVRIFMFPVWGLSIYCLMYCVNYANKHQLLAIPGYFYVMTAICSIPAIKLALLYLRNRNMMVKVVCAAIICIFFAGYNFLMNKAVIAVVLPILLIMVYPVAALRQSIRLKCREIDDHPIELPWKLIIVVIAFILSFGSYTYIINVRQEKELETVQSQISFPPVGEYLDLKWSDIAMFIKRNMPDYPESFNQDLDNYIEKKNNYFSFSKLDVCNEYLDYLIMQYYKGKEYEKVFKLVLFKLELMSKYGSGAKRGQHVNGINYILEKYQPTSKDLARYIYLRKLANCRNYNLLRRGMRYPVSELISNQAYSTLLSSHRSMHPRYKAGMLNSTPLFLSPLCLNDKLSYLKTALYLIKCLDFQIGGCGVPDMPGYRANLHLIQHHLWGYLGLLDVKGQKSVIAAAMYNYKIKYGKFPDKLTDLVPAYLNDKDLVLFNEYKELFSNENAIRLSPLLVRADEKSIMKFINLDPEKDHD